METFTALKPFRIATDASGITARDVAAGDAIEVPDDLAGGLLAEGFIKVMAPVMAMAAELVDRKPARKDR